MVREEESLRALTFDRLAWIGASALLVTPGGPWLKYRGHLTNVSQNMLVGAINAVNGLANKVENQLTGQWDTVPSTARSYQSAGIPWIVIGDDNYGEGSSREHAALEPRFLGACAIVARSFARIHETNLKKQGVLPLSFQNRRDYDKVQPNDWVDLLEVESLAPGSVVRMRLRHEDGSEQVVPLVHSFNQGQIEWFKAGSALNLIAKANEVESEQRQGQS